MTEMESLLDTRRFKILASFAVAGMTLAACTLLAHRAVAHHRAVRGAALYAAGEPARAYPYLLNAARASLMGSLNAAPLLDLGEVATWAIEDPSFVKYHRELGPAVAARLAFVCYARALQRRPTSSTAMAGMADLFRRVGSLGLLSPHEPSRSLGDLDEEPARSAPDRLVEEAYRKAIQMEPTNYFWYAYLADFYQQRGRREEALPLYAQAIELMPDLSWHYYLGSTGPLPPDMFEAALAGMRRALESNEVFLPDKIQFNLGLLYDRQRDYSSALQHYRQAIQMAADPSRYLYHAAAVLLATKQHDEALEYFKRALARGGLNQRQEVAARTEIGRMLLARGEGKAAVEYLARASLLDPASYAARVNLGHAYRSLGEAEEAQAEYQRALQLEPGHAEIYLALIEMYRSRGDFARAIPLARRLTEMYPDDPGYKAQLDGLYRQMGTSPPG